MITEVNEMTAKYNYILKQYGIYLIIVVLVVYIFFETYGGACHVAHFFCNLYEISLGTLYFHVVKKIWRLNFFLILTTLDNFLHALIFDLLILNIISGKSNLTNIVYLMLLDSILNPIICCLIDVQYFL